MPYNFVPNTVDNAISRTERIELNQNFQSIRTLFQQVGLDIDESNATQAALIERIDNLVLNADDNTDLEVVDARVDEDGTVYNLLKNRLDAIFGKSKDYTDSLYGGIRTEVIDARGGFATLDARLDDFDERFDSNREENVIQNGAKGDGIQDDAPFIQAVLNKAKNSAYGVRVIIPPGNYRLGATLIVYSNTAIVADGAYLIRDHDSYILQNGETGASYSGYEGQSNITIQGGTYDMRGATKGGAGAMMLGHARNLYISGVKILDVNRSHGIEVNSSKKVRILNSEFLGFYDAIGDRLYSEALQFDLAKPSTNGADPTFPPFGAHDNTACDDVLVMGCTFGNSGSPGAMAWGRGIGSHSATIGRWQQNIRIINNFFEGLPQWAIRGYGWRNVQVIGNVIVSCGGGIAFDPNELADPKDTYDVNGVQTNASQPSSRLMIANNIILDTVEEHIIRVEGEPNGGNMNDVTIIGNTCIKGTGSTKNGIWVVRGNGVVIQGNHVYQPGQNAISTSYSSKEVIAGNVIRQAGKHGIFVGYDTQDVGIKDNIIDTTQQHGIFLSDNVDTTQITGNTVRAASRESSGGFSGIRLSAGIDRPLINGNTVRVATSGNQAGNALYITNTCSNVTRYGNDFRGSWTVSAIYDGTTSPVVGGADAT